MDCKYASAEGEPALAPDQERLTWLLIAQFCQDAALRYGPDSAQARALSTFCAQRFGGP